MVECSAAPRLKNPIMVWSLAPRPWHHSDFTTLNTIPDPTNGPHQRRGLQPLLNTKPRCYNPSHRILPPLPNTPRVVSWSVIVSGASRNVYSDQVGHQTSDIRLLWTAITQTINPAPPSPLVV